MPGVEAGLVGREVREVLAEDYSGVGRAVLEAREKEAALVGSKVA